MKHGWPCSLFTVDMETADLARDTFVRFFDALEPAFGHQVSIGQTNTIILCPALTSHSELSQEEQTKAQIFMTTMRIAMGTDNVKALMAHFIQAVKLHIDPAIPGFSEQFMGADEIEDLYLRTSLTVSEQHYQSSPSMHELLAGK